MSVGFTIPMAQALLADGRAAEVARMLEPLLAMPADAAPRPSLREEVKLRCLLARIRLLEDDDVEGARRLLAPVSARGAVNEASAGIRAEVALWLGWCDLLEGPASPHGIPATRFATAAYLSRTGSASPATVLWCRIGHSLLAAARGYPEVAAHHATAARRLQRAISCAQADRMLQRAPECGTAAAAELPDHIWTGSAMERVARLAGLASRVQSPVLIIGERGSGRRHLARAINSLSADPPPPFRIIQGTDRAERDSAAALQHATATEGRPTVCLHEVDALPASVQKLAATADKEGAIRLICTTTRDVCALGESGKLDPSLLEACSLLPIELPPLRKRSEDVELLVHHFLHRLGTAHALPPAVTDEAMTMLVRYQWPGNVRQLRNEIERALVHVQSEPAPVIRASVLSPDVRGTGRDGGHPSAEAGDLDRILSQTERAVIEAALVQTGGQVAASADKLGLSRQGLYKKMKRLGVEPARYQNGQEQARERANV